MPKAERCRSGGTSSGARYPSLNASKRPTRAGDSNQRSSSRWSVVVRVVDEVQRHHYAHPPAVLQPNAGNHAGTLTSDTMAEQQLMTMTGQSTGAANAPTTLPRRELPTPPPLYYTCLSSLQVKPPPLTPPSALPKEDLIPQQPLSTHPCQFTHGQTIGNVWRCSPTSPPTRCASRTVSSPARASSAMYRRASASRVRASISSSCGRPAQRQCLP
jgi:hypothetical protein